MVDQSSGVEGPVCVLMSKFLCTGGDPCKRDPLTINSFSAWLLFCSLQQAGFWCYANLPSDRHLHGGQTCPVHLIPCLPLLLCSSPFNLETIFSSPLLHLFCPHAFLLHMSSPLTPTSFSLSSFFLQCFSLLFSMFLFLQVSVDLSFYCPV